MSQSVASGRSAPAPLAFHNAVIQSQAPHKIFPSMRGAGNGQRLAVVPDHAAPSVLHGMAFGGFLLALGVLFHCLI